jgi:hypothetical protein
VRNQLKGSAYVRFEEVSDISRNPSMPVTNCCSSA